MALLPNHAALHRRNPNQQNDPNSPNQQISPSDAYDIYKYSQGDYPGSGLLDMFQGGNLISQGSTTGATGPIASPGILSGLGSTGAGWGSAGGGAAAEAGVMPVAGGLSNAPSSSAGLLGGKGASGGSGAAGSTGMMSALGAYALPAAVFASLPITLWHAYSEKGKPSSTEKRIKAEGFGGQTGDAAWEAYKADQQRIKTLGYNAENKAALGQTLTPQEQTALQVRQEQQKRDRRSEQETID